MRKLVYVGTDNMDTIVKTTSYDEMKEWKEKGFVFKEVMEEITKEYEPTSRAKKVANIMARKRG